MARTRQPQCTCGQYTQVRVDVLDHRQDPQLADQLAEQAYEHDRVDSHVCHHAGSLAPTPAERAHYADLIAAVQASARADGSHYLRADGRPRNAVVDDREIAHVVARVSAAIRQGIRPNWQAIADSMPSGPRSTTCVRNVWKHNHQEV